MLGAQIKCEWVDGKLIALMIGLVCRNCGNWSNIALVIERDAVVSALPLWTRSRVTVRLLDFWISCSVEATYVDVRGESPLIAIMN